MKLVFLLSLISLNTFAEQQEIQNPYAGSLFRHCVRECKDDYLDCQLKMRSKVRDCLNHLHTGCFSYRRVFHQGCKDLKEICLSNCQVIKLEQ